MINKDVFNQLIGLVGRVFANGPNERKQNQTKLRSSMLVIS